MSDPRWEATLQGAIRIERVAEAGYYDQLRAELESIVARFASSPADDSPARTVLALTGACLAVLDAEDEDDDDFE